MREFKVPYYWKDHLKELLLSEGFDRVIRQIEEWLEENELLVLDERVKPQ